MTTTRHFLLRYPRRFWRICLPTTSYSTTSVCCNNADMDVGHARKKYILAMFPYPSGRLHLGHLRVYALSDVLSRYYALKGYQVIHPIGWDAFGLPAENAAIERGIDSAKWTEKNIEEMRVQLVRTGVKFDWEREICTCNPDYFRWTQWIFLQLHKHGFVRRTFSEVNWDPVDRTVLAEEQVDSHGHSWRSGALVEKRRLSQWVVDTPRYARRLLDGLAPLQFEWHEVASIQQNWLGPCDVYRFLLPVESEHPMGHQKEQLDLRIDDPSQICAAQFVVLSADHEIAKEARKQGRLGGEKAGQHFDILDGHWVHNFVTGHPMPLVVLTEEAAEEEKDNGSSANFHMGSRLGWTLSGNSLDRSIADRLGIGPVKRVEVGAEEVLRIAQSLNFGGYLTSRTLRDWVVSRQRAWGTPIPMVLEEDGKGTRTAPLPEEKLPMLGSQRGQRVQVPSFTSGWGRMEKDTLDTYFDSSWYFLRFLDPHNRHKAFDPAIVNRLMPVDVYVGGVEHAHMHLFYARFICHFLHGLGLLPGPEPFARFIPLGIVRSQSFQLISNGKYVPPDEVDGNPRLPTARLVHRTSGEPVQVQFEKMSKSKYNGLDPLEVIERHGADLTRLQLLFEARPNMPIDWPQPPYPTYQTKNLKRWLGQVRSLVDDYVVGRRKEAEQKNIADDLLEPLANGRAEKCEQMEATYRDIYNRHVKAISMYLEVLRYHNTALIRLIDMTKALLKVWPARQQLDVPLASSAELERCMRALVVMLGVFAPETATSHWDALRTLPKSDEATTPRWSWRADAPLDAQRWPQIDQDGTIDFLLVTFGTLFQRPVPISEVLHLSDAQLERYSRKHCHDRFFQRLEERQLHIQSSSVERIPGLCIALHLKMAENVHKRAITAIIQKYREDGSKKKASAEER